MPHPAIDPYNASQTAKDILDAWPEGSTEAVALVASSLTLPWQNGTFCQKRKKQQPLT